jgi:DNA polymerase III subunit delta'
VSWSAIVGQTLAVRLLRQAVTADRVAHAYLFVGPEGVGKRTVALELAKALNCHAPLPDGSACDTCLSCRKISSVPSAHPDVQVIAPEGRFIKTDQMRALQSDMYARPSEGRRRVAIIDGAERMNAEAGNRVLKLLEEPPAYAELILLTANLSGVLPTLISRCQVVNFPPLGADAVATVLQKQMGLEPAAARLFASLSGGSIGRAAALSGDADFAQRREQVYALLKQLASMDDLALIGAAEILEKDKEHLEEWLELCTAWLRDAVVCQTGSHQLVINADRLRDVESLARQVDAASLLRMLGFVTEARAHLHKNANARLALDVMLLRLGEVARQAQ